MNYTTEYQDYPTPNRNYKSTRLENAINQAIDECVEQNVLKDVLTEQRAEVLGVLLSTFNKELYEKDLKEDAFSQGIVQGRTEGAQSKLTELIQKKLAKGKSLEMIADELEESIEVIKKLVDKLET